MVVKWSIPACAGETAPPNANRTSSEVYPRVCGGNKISPTANQEVKGLSPRVRGKHSVVSVSAMVSGSIPACAGETYPVADVPFSIPVYPRVCGGNWHIGAPRYMARGLSPRVRGKPYQSYEMWLEDRSIPACAGETASISIVFALLSVYPRVCGGNGGGGDSVVGAGGLSPRVRGKQCGTIVIRSQTGSIPACAGETAATTYIAPNGTVYPRVCGGNLVGFIVIVNSFGLSPRVRGKPLRLTLRRPKKRSIPACAGETGMRIPDMRRTRVYPRVCGGNIPCTLFSVMGPGLSPRVRGKRPSRLYALTPCRSIPACAGETLALALAFLLVGVYPRVCGGNIQSCVCMMSFLGLSPRVRGKLAGMHIRTAFQGSIPACAGETGLSALRKTPLTVYPRVCGGNRSMPFPTHAGRGLSPRVRGKLAWPSVPCENPRSIPACAGET